MTSPTTTAEAIMPTHTPTLKIPSTIAQPLRENSSSKKEEVNNAFIILLLYEPMSPDLKVFPNNVPFVDYHTAHTLLLYYVISCSSGNQLTIFLHRMQQGSHIRRELPRSYSNRQKSGLQIQFHKRIAIHK